MNRTASRGLLVGLLHEVGDETRTALGLRAHSPVLDPAGVGEANEMRLVEQVAQGARQADRPETVEDLVGGATHPAVLENR